METLKINEASGIMKYFDTLQITHSYYMFKEFAIGGYFVFFLSQYLG